MGFYKSIFNKKIVIAGRSKGASPSFLMPPSAAAAKQGYQIYEVVDLLCEGEVAGLVGQKGEFLSTFANRNQKNFNTEVNIIGGTNPSIDQGVYFNELALRDPDGNSTHSKYDIEFRSGKILQGKSNIVSQPSKLNKVSAPIKGPYDLTVGGENGARTGSGSRDIRREGTSARNFVTWQKYVPIEQAAKPFNYTNYDKDVDQLDIGLQIDSLSDTKSFSTKGENKAGKSKMGTPLPLTVTFTVTVGKADKDGNLTADPAVFTVRPGKGKTVGDGNGQLAIRGIITAPYTLTLEDINLPTLSDTDLYNYIEIAKVEHETISNLVNRSVGVATITQKYLDTFYYPGSCYVASQIDSQYHPQIPSRTFRLKGKKIKIPSNYSPINTDGTDKRFSDSTSTRGNTIYDGPWDGTFQYAWSDNPAWIYYDILTNRRYGLGSYLQDIDIIDKWTLYEIGMYCDAVTMNDGSATTNASGAGKFIGLDDGFGGLEPRFSCNILMKDQTDAFDAIQNLARSFRAMTYFNNSCVSVKVDRPYFFEDFNNTTNSAPKENKFPPHLIFNNLSVKDGMFSYADVDRQTKLSAVEVSFLDKRNNYTAQTEYVEDPEAIKHVGLNFKQIDGIGVTSKAQAHRLAKYILFESQNTTETISFNAGLEALLVQPGDIIRVEDEMKNFTRNFGTVLGASGETNYYDPDGTTNINTLNSGKGPSAIIVEPAIGSDLTDYVTGGNIHIYNPIGKSGIEDFYTNPSSNNELYKEIHNPQVISLKIKESAPGQPNVSYEVIDSGGAIFINGLETFADGNTGSQWFSEKDANIRHGSIYNIDSSGRNPKYYRVLNISEDKNLGFNVSATIHHTGKFKFVEENISFDLGVDTFQPNLAITDVVRPNIPSNVVTGAFTENADKSLNLNLTITDPSEKVPEKYVIILDEPDSTTRVSEHFKSSSTTTNVTLSGASKIDQIGTYSLSVFSQNVTPITVRSDASFSLSFTTDIDDFSFNNQEAFTEYSNISINTAFSSTFDNAAETGVAQNSFFENDRSLNAIVNLEFEDVFGNTGFDVQQTILAQKINILDIGGNLKSSSFRTLTNDNVFAITNAEINELFGYTGDGKYRVPPGLHFEVGSFTLTAGNNSNKTVSFESGFSDPPAVFTQQKVSGSFNDVYRPLGRRFTNNNGNNFSVRSFDDDPDDNFHETNYSYVACKTGNYVVDTNRIEIHFVNKNNTTGYQAVEFAVPFLSTPNLIIELQQPGSSSSEKETTETCITGLSHTGFHFAAFQDSTSAAGGTGKYAYIATDQLGLNNQTGTDLPAAVLNYASTGVANYSFGDPILNEFNASEPSVTDAKYNHDQYAVLCQRSGEDNDLRDKFFVVHETGNQNRLYQQVLTSGLDNGIRMTNTDGANNHVLITGENLSVGTSDFLMIAWVKFDPGLNGKQYLLESHNNGTGIAWFQSGDGKNYVNLNGIDYLAITGNGGASLNDGNLHHLQVAVKRQTAISGHLDGTTVNNSSPNAVSHTNTSITQTSTGFTISNVGSGMVNNSNSFNGDYTGGGSLYQNTATTGLRVKTTGSNNTWVLCDDDPANTYFTGFRLTGGVGSGMADNPNSFTGTYTGGGNLFINTTTSGLRIKTTGTNNTWVLCDDDPANSYSHNRIAWSGGENVNFPGNVTSWTGGATILDGTITDSVSPLDNFDSLLSHNKIAWSGGDASNANHPTFVTSWTGGSTAALLGDTSAPVFSDLLLQTFDSQTGYKVLGNSELVGNSLTSGYVINYIGLRTGQNPSNTFFTSEDNFKSSYKGGAQTKFILDVDDFPNLVDTSTVDTATVSTVGAIERSQAIIDRNKTSNFQFLQIGVTGIL